jgi:hypothetical protein
VPQGRLLLMSLLLLHLVEGLLLLVQLLLAHEVLVLPERGEALEPMLLLLKHGGLGGIHPAVGVREDAQAALKLPAPLL